MRQPIEEKILFKWKKWVIGRDSRQFLLGKQGKNSLTWQHYFQDLGHLLKFLLNEEARKTAKSYKNLQEFIEVYKLLTRDLKKTAERLERKLK